MWWLQSYGISLVWQSILTSSVCQTVSDWPIIAVLLCKLRSNWPEISHRSTSLQLIIGWFCMVDTYVLHAIRSVVSAESLLSVSIIRLKWKPQLPNRGSRTAKNTLIRTFFEKSCQIIWRDVKNALSLHPLKRWNAKLFGLATIFERVKSWQKSDWLLSHMQANKNLVNSNKSSLVLSVPDWKKETKIKKYNEEFDPGSGWTLATGLTHASRGRSLRTETGARVSNAYVTCP